MASEGKISRQELNNSLNQELDNYSDSANNLTLHKNNTDNPHSVTASQVGAYHQEEKNIVKRDLSKYKLVRSGKDSEGLFTIIEYREADDTLVMKSTISGGTSPQYTTRTEEWYEPDGTTVAETVTFTITYDSDGDVLSEVF